MPASLGGVVQGLIHEYTVHVNLSREVHALVCSTNGAGNPCLESERLSEENINSDGLVRVVVEEVEAVILWWRGEPEMVRFEKKKAKTIENTLTTISIPCFL